MPGAKTIKKNTNSTQNKSQTHHAKQYEVTSFLSTDCELSTETCSKNVYSLGPWSFPPAMYEWAWRVFLISFVFLAYNLQIHITFYLLTSDTCFLYQTVGSWPTNQVNTITTIVKWVCVLQFFGKKVHICVRLKNNWWIAVKRGNDKYFLWKWGAG